MALSITDLFTPLTSDQYRAKLVTELLTLQIPADQWRAGGVASTMLTVTAILLAMMSSIISTIIQGFFLPTATGNGLKLLAYYVYGVTVPAATYASGNVTLTNSGGGVYTQAAGTYSALNPTTGQTYVNTTAFTLGALSVLTVPMQAVNIGTAGNASPNTITQNVTTLLGVAVTNPASLVGIDAPTDPAIRLLCSNALAAASVRGVRSVYAYAIQTALNPVTGLPVNINRWSISEASHVGTVSLTVASPSGPVDANDLIGVQTSIEAKARPSGVAATAYAATTKTYSPSITVWVTAPSTVAQADIKAAIDAAITTYVSTYAIGGLTASDDLNSNLTGLFKEGITGAVAAGCVTAGASLISVKGATDLALVNTDVAVDSVVTNVVIVPITGGALS